MPYFTKANGIAVSGLATAHGESGTITSEALTTIPVTGAYVLTLRNSYIGPNANVMASVGNGTNTQGTPVVSSVAVTEGQAVITILNIHATLAFNGTLKIGFMIAN